VTIGLHASFSPFIASREQRFLIKTFDVGDSFSSITVAGGSGSGPYVTNVSERRYTVKFRLISESGDYVDGSSREVGKTTNNSLGIQVRGIFVSGTGTDAAKFRNKRVRLEFVVNAMDTVPDGLVDLTVTFGASNNKIEIVGNVITSAYANRLFGNGFFFAKNEEQYAGLIVDDTNGPVAEFRNGDQGFRFTNAGLKRWHTQFGWIPIDGVIMRGKIVTLGGGGQKQSIFSSWYKDYVSTSARTVFSCNSEAPYTVSVALPTSISSNTSFTASDYMVQLTGLRRTKGGTALGYEGESGIFASVYSQSKDTFSVYTGDDETQNSGGFYFEVKVID
jgi:hypothetical protein